MAELQQIVAIGLLNQDDLDRLGPTFNRAFPLDGTNCFDELLQALDGVEGQGVRSIGEQRPD